MKNGGMFHVKHYLMNKNIQGIKDKKWKEYQTMNIR